MKNSKMSKVLLTSILGAAVGASALVGGTYAIFTSEAKTDLVVTSGKVSIEADIKDLKMYSGEWDDTTEAYKSVEVLNHFTNGGTATLTNGVLTLDRISPMDKVSFNINIQNKSNIAAKYRVTTTLKGDVDLFTALNVTIDSEEYLGFTDVGEWTMMDVDFSKDIAVEVELPEEATSDVADKSIQIAFAVEAVQGNAHVESLDLDDNTYPLYNATDLRLFAGYANAGKMNNSTGMLMDNIDLENVEWTQIDGNDRNITVDGQEYTISNLKISDGHDAGFFKTGYGCTIQNVNFDKASVEGVGRIGVVCGLGRNVTVKNVNVTNSSVTAKVTDNDDGDKAGALVGFLSGESDAFVEDCTVTNCKVAGYRDIGGAIGFTSGTYTVKNITVKDTEIINNRINNYKNYTTDAEFDVNEIVGEVGEYGTPTNVIAENVTINTVYNINNADDLVALATQVNSNHSFSGKLVSLKADIDLTGINWTPIGDVENYPGHTFAGTFDGENHVISNLKTTGTNDDYVTSGLFGSITGTIKNIVLSDFEVTSTHYAGALVGYIGQSGALIENCTIKNGTVYSTPELVGGEYDNGDKVGGIVGYIAAGNVVKNCTVDNVTVEAYRDLGGIVGANSGEITGCTIINSRVIQNNENGYKDSITTYGAIAGRYADLGGTESNNTVTNVEVTTK